MENENVAGEPHNEHIALLQEEVATLKKDSNALEAKLKDAENALSDANATIEGMKEYRIQGYGDIFYSTNNLIDGQIMEALAKCFESGRNQQLLSTLEFLANG